MKTILTLLLTSILALPASAKGIRRNSSRTYRSSTTHVLGHTTKRGTYIPAHNRTSPNKSKWDNWSSSGRVNPYTGKRGYKRPY